MHDLHTANLIYNYHSFTALLFLIVQQTELDSKFVFFSGLTTLTGDGQVLRQVYFTGLRMLKRQGHPTDRFGKFSVRKALNPLQFSKNNFRLELS